MIRLGYRDAGFAIGASRFAMVDYLDNIQHALLGGAAELRWELELTHSLERVLAMQGYAGWLWRMR